MIRTPISLITSLPFDRICSAGCFCATYRMIASHQAGIAEVFVLKFILDGLEKEEREPQTYQFSWFGRIWRYIRGRIATSSRITHWAVEIRGRSIRNLSAQRILPSLGLESNNEDDTRRDLEGRSTEEKLGEKRTSGNYSLEQY